MDLTKVLRQLHEELENLDAAILSLERLEESGRKRGRPPDWLAEVKKSAPVNTRSKRKSLAKTAPAGHKARAEADHPAPTEG